MGRGARSKFMEIQSFSPLPTITFEKMQFHSRPANAGRLSHTQSYPHQEDDEQVARVEGVKEPLGDLGLHAGGQEDEGRSQGLFRHR